MPLLADPNSIPQFPSDNEQLAYQCIDALVDPHVQAVESHTNGPILALQEQLRAASPEAYAIYEQIDQLIGIEKLNVQRVCFLVGMVSGVSLSPDRRAAFIP